ncbi:MAG TPA: hypothetical protein GX497_17340, partial [Bacillus bacterium]|nr:hypothetical protein [Bacillus sp. (in: firmicutes)]
TPNGGQSGNNGQLLNGNGSEGNSGQVPIGGQVGNGNQIVNGNEQQGNKSKPTNGGQVGNDGQVSINYEFLSFLEETGSGAKKYLISYPKRLGEMLDGVLSIQAGFKIKDLKTNPGNRNLYQILGENKAVNGNNPMHKFLNKRYQKYLENFNDNKLILWNGNLRSDDKVKAKKINIFFNSNTKFQTALKRIGKDFSDNWNPFSNPFNSANKGIGKIINKEFFKLSKIAKGNGLGNVLLSTGGRIIDYASDSKKFFKSTSFAAGITTDVAFGVEPLQ